VKKVWLIWALFLILVFIISFNAIQYAQFVPDILNETNSLTIVNASVDNSGTKVSNIRCKIRNDSSKQVLAFAVLWTVTTTLGKSPTISTIEDRSLISSLKKMDPGDVVECEASGSITAGSQDSIAKVIASVDYVLFSDGSTSGKNQAGSSSMINNRQMTARYMRRQLLKIYNEKGVEELLRELNR
jgi:hypothetical protein